MAQSNLQLNLRAARTAEISRWITILVQGASWLVRICRGLYSITTGSQAASISRRVMTILWGVYARNSLFMKMIGLALCLWLVRVVLLATIWWLFWLMLSLVILVVRSWWLR